MIMIMNGGKEGRDRTRKERRGEKRKEEEGREEDGWDGMGGRKEDKEQTGKRTKTKGKEE